MTNAPFPTCDFKFHPRRGEELVPRALKLIVVAQKDAAKSTLAQERAYLETVDSIGYFIKFPVVVRLRL